VIRRYEGYHGGWTKGTPIDEIRFVITSDDATTKALAQTGELGLSSSSLTSATFDAIGALPNYKILQHATSTGFYIKLNSKLAPTDDIHIRRAIALAMDYDTIRNVIFPGAPLNGPLASTFKSAYLDSLAAPVFDLEKAKAEVALSKYAGQEPIKISHAYVAGLGFEDEIGLMFKSNLEQIGFEVALQPEPWNRITELAAKPETTPNTTQVFNGATYPSPDSIFYVQYHSKAKGTWSSMEWLEDSEIDALIDKARETTDVPAQNAIYKDLQQKLVDRQSDVYMLAESQRYAANKCLQGYQWIPMMSWDLNFSNFWWDCSKG
jgi:peptide/nickel transport system substrate-binding protein